MCVYTQGHDGLEIGITGAAAATTWQPSFGQRSAGSCDSNFSRNVEAVRGGPMMNSGFSTANSRMCGWRAT